MAEISPSQNGGPDYNQTRGKRAHSSHPAHGASAKQPEMPATGATAAPDPADIRAALAHLLTSPPFGKSAQLSNFLHFVVEETLAGRGSRIKAYTIATAALGRDQAFDPQTDPIVRVEAARLRRALRDYYANGGADDAVMIELPTGSYMPVFYPRRRQRSSIAAWLRATAGELTAFVRQNPLLLLAIFIIATAVCLTVELLDAFFFDTF